TIEAFERQVEHLYGRGQARVFPGLGPTLSESFYAQTQNYPQRLYVALLPHNKTIFNTILELIELYHRTLQNLQRASLGSANPYGGRVEPSTQQWLDLLDPYVTSLTYFLANRELDSIRTDIKGDVIPNLERDGYLPIEPRDLTGGTSTDEVTRTLERLEQTGSPDRPADAVLATNMISHGVDIDRFNSMIFYGMPRQTAEYIQASSRVGRAHVGIVFVCLHPARERDQSHYTYFAKYHEFIGQLIEPVAINRWAKFSLRRTVPGLFMAVLLQLLSNSAGEARNGGKYYMRDYVRQKISNGSIQADQFISLLEEAYLVNSPTNVAEQNFRAEINRRVRMFLDQIQNASPSCKYVSDALIPKPMISLRDVDESLVIELDTTCVEAQK
ncbi:MAG TPA: helicase-related protein, partial [Nitrososphaera sp.]|nr:helicase-related protein [Nitrososphaera sp.]